MNYLVLLCFSILSCFTVLSQDQMFDVCPLKIGEEIPSSNSLTDIDGKNIEFSEILKEEKLIVVFYRGGWCPYCTNHLSALGRAKEEIDALGFKLIGITPDQFDSLAVSQLKSNTEYELYSDHKAELITAFGLGWKIDEANYVKYRDRYRMDAEKWSGEKHHILPVPAVYVIVEGVIQYNYVNPNYSTRLKPETLIAILKSL